MKKYTILVLTSAFVFTLFNTHAQTDETLFGRSGLKLTGAWGGSNIGLTSFDNENALLRGGFGGLEFNKEVLIGLGGVRTDEAVTFDNNGRQDEFKLDFGGLYVGYVPRSFQVIHPKFSFLTGGGKVKVNGKDDDNIFVFQPAGGAEVNVFRWFKLGIEGGYRFVSGTDFDRLKDDDLSSFFVEMKFRFGWSWGR